MSKIRVLFCGEYSGLGTGYANWHLNLLHGLHKTNKYELAELATFCTEKEANSANVPWKVYPNNVVGDQKKENLYRSNPNNMYGQWRFDPTCLNFKPDIVVDMRDPWMFEFECMSPFREYFKWLIMPPVDSIPQKNEWVTIFNNADCILPYTTWAKQCLTKYKHLKICEDISPAGVDSDIFKPLKVDKKSFGLPEDRVIIGSVMRNQKRKLIPALLEVISKLDDKYVLYLHTTYPDISSWDLPTLLLEYNIFDRVYFTYVCYHCKHHETSVYKQQRKKCSRCGHIASSISSTNSGISETDLAQIYNLFDIYIQYAICEGFGMPQIEASSCGIPVFSVDYSAMSEVVRNINGFPIPVSSLFYESESGAKRAYPSVDETIKLIVNYQENLSDKLKLKIKEQTRELTKQIYSWQNAVNVWEKTLDSIDISTNKSWSNTESYIIPKDIHYYNGEDNYTFLESICVNILKSPFLMKTQMIQYMLYNLDHGYVVNNGNYKPYTRDHVLNTLMQYAENKQKLDSSRTNISQ